MKKFASLLCITALLLGALVCFSGCGEWFDDGSYDGEETTSGGGGQPATGVTANFPLDAVVITKTTSRANPVGSEIKNSSDFYLHVWINASNTADQASAVAVSVSIPDQYEEFFTGEVSGSVTLKRDTKEEGGVGRIYMYTGEVLLAAGETRGISFYIPFRAYNRRNVEYTSVITISCASAQYTQHIVNKPHSLTVLSAPQVRIERDRLIFDAVPNADQYGYKLDDGKLYKFNTTVIDTSGWSAGAHKIEISTLGDGVEFADSPEYCILNIEKLPAAMPSVLVKQGKKVLSWSSVKDCTAYEILDGNRQVLRRVEGATEISLDELDLRAGETVLYVLPVVEGKSGYVAEAGLSPVSVKRLAAPVLRVTSKLGWDPVTDADYYDVYKEGVFFRRVTAASCSLLGEHGESYYGERFYVVAVSEDVNVADSAPSNTVNSTVG